MQETTRALGILALAVLLVAPVANTVLDEALAAADRLPFRDADWDIQPPDQDPPEDPPEGEGDQDGDADAPTQGGASCPLQRDIVALFNHPPVDEDPLDATAARSDSTGTPAQRTFEVTNRTRGLGIAFEVDNATGTLEALVHADGQEDTPAFSVDKSNPAPDSLNVTGTVTPPELEPGPWIAQLSHESHHDELVFFVVAFSCQEADA